MKHASTREVFDYWNDRRGNRIAPERGDIEPGAIRRVLKDTFILAHEPPGGHRFRLAGTQICALFCRELKGEAFIDLWSKAEQAALRDHVAIVANESEGMIIGITGSNADGAHIDLELLLLPLVHRNRSQARLLGVLAPLSVPYWVGVSPVENLGCGTVRHLGPAADIAAAPRLVPGAEAPPYPELALEGARLRHGLMIYNGGRS
jgi:hypothetical protein